uniref:Holin n=1 Tax=Podoviridae sp. ctval4 TaxID=2826585 RepID=A0A8S5N0V5_9CAUD|nr:MAG TPA: holin [Podoviridae sp. ctval4]DAR57830.1 MAG TPA: holin [Caudoviricetes sp.]
MEKIGICAGIGVVSTGISAAFGGWDNTMSALVFFMVIDYLTGLAVAGIFKKSTKTADGGLESKAGWKGLIRKFSVLAIVLIAAQLDVLLNSSYIRDVVIYSFLANELLSIIENMGLMGVPLPTVLENAVTILNKKGDKNSNEL